MIAKKQWIQSATVATEDAWRPLAESLAAALPDTALTLRILSRNPSAVMGGMSIKVRRKTWIWWPRMAVRRSYLKAASGR